MSEITASTMREQVVIGFFELLTVPIVPVVPTVPIVHGDF
jgi:hypothetical protein